jgi:ABC-2 type transport system ATP-binding protein
VLLEVDHLTKVYKGGTIANDGVTVAIAAGEVFGLLGPNGAGKTTLVNQLVGLSTPTGGRILLDGTDVTAASARRRGACALQPQAQVPARGLTSREFVELVARLRGATRADARARTTSLFEALDLGEWADRVTDAVSGGVLRLIAFAAAVAHPASVIVLDEPTNDVDPLRRRTLWREIRAAADAGSAVLLVTHNVVEAERAVDRVALMSHAHVIASGTPAELRHSVAGHLRLDVQVTPDRQPSRPEGSRVRVSGHQWTLEVDRADVDAAVRWALDAQAIGDIEEFSLTPATLEDAYAELMGFGGAAGGNQARA